MVGFRPDPDGKKLFLWREVLVLMDRRLLPKGSASKGLCPGWEGSATISTARFGVLEVYRPWRDARLQANNLLSRANDTQSAFIFGSGNSVPDGDGGGEYGLDDGSAPSFVFSRLNYFNYHRKCIRWWALLIRELKYSIHLRSWVMMVPRKQKESTV